jgi:hypothetical protein
MGSSGNDDYYFRMAALGGAVTSGLPRFQDFRQSENIEDRRKQKLSQSPFLNDADYGPLSALVAKDVGLREWFYGDPAAEKGSLNRALGMIDLIKDEFDRTK